MGLALSLCVFQSCSRGQKSDTDEHALVLIKNAEMATHDEIKAANIAVSTSKNPRVIGFAKMLIQDYNDDLEKLKDVKADVTAADSSRITSFYKKQMNSISGLSGRQFDKAYMNSEMDGTGRLLMYYVDASQGKKDSTNTYSRQIAPGVQAHLDSAKNILASLK